MRESRIPPKLGFLRSICIQVILYMLVSMDVYLHMDLCIFVYVSYRCICIQVIIYMLVWMSIYMDVCICVCISYRCIYESDYIHVSMNVYLYGCLYFVCISNRCMYTSDFYIRYCTMMTFVECKRGGLWVWVGHGLCVVSKC